MTATGFTTSSAPLPKTDQQNSLYRLEYHIANVNKFRSFYKNGFSGSLNNSALCRDKTEVRSLIK